MFQKIVFPLKKKSCYKIKQIDITFLHSPKYQQLQKIERALG